MTGLEFAVYVKAKLNRLDSSKYQDVRDEEIFFFAHESLKALTLEFDTLRFSGQVLTKTLLVYLASVTEEISKDLTASTTDPVYRYFDLERILKPKSVKIWVEMNTNFSSEKGWSTGNLIENTSHSSTVTESFTKSFPDSPNYRFLDNKFIVDVVEGKFDCTKCKVIILKYPELIDELSVLEYPFMSELENKTVTLLLENLENSRLQTQPAVSRM